MAALICATCAFSRSPQGAGVARSRLVARPAVVSAHPVMDGSFDLARRELLGALASSMAVAGPLDAGFFQRLFGRESPVRGRATTATIPDVPDYYSTLPSFQRRITPEALALRSVPTTCPPVNQLTQDVLKLDVIRQLPPAVRETLASNGPFWSGFERGIVSIRDTLAASPPLLQLFVTDDLTRPTDRAVNELRATLDTLDAAVKERNVTRVADDVLALALKLEELARFTVGRFPYSVPRGGRFETLPRLLGRGALAPLALMPLCGIDSASERASAEQRALPCRIVLTFRVHALAPSRALCCPPLAAQPMRRSRFGA